MQVQLAKACATRAEPVKAKRLCNLLWALAKTTLRGPAALPSMHLEVLLQRASNLHACSTQQLSTMAWAMATLQCDARPTYAGFLEEISKAVRDETIAWTPRQVAIVSWSLAKLRQVSWPFLHQVVVSSAERLAECSGQDLANILWAAATVELGMLAEDAGEGEVTLTLKGLEAIAQRALHGHHMTAQGFSNVMWACACLSIGIEKDGAVMHQLVSDFMVKGQDLQLRDVSNIAWSLAILGHQLPTVLESHASQLLKNSLKFGPDIEESKAILGLIWSEAFTCASQGLETKGALSFQAAQCLHHLGLHLDMEVKGRQLPACMLPACNSFNSGAEATAFGVPQVLLDLPDRMVLLKPSGWEVDQSSAGSRLEWGRHQ